MLVHNIEIIVTSLHPMYMTKCAQNYQSQSKIVVRCLVATVPPALLIGFSVEVLGLQTHTYNITTTAVSMPCKVMFHTLLIMIT